MGKRKGSAPQKADLTKRQALTWNMLDSNIQIPATTQPTEVSSVSKSTPRQTGLLTSVLTYNVKCLKFNLKLLKK